MRFQITSFRHNLCRPVALTDQVNGWASRKQALHRNCMEKDTVHLPGPWLRVHTIIWVHSMPAACRLHGLSFPARLKATRYW